MTPTRYLKAGVVQKRIKSATKLTRRRALLKESHDVVTNAPRHTAPFASTYRAAHGVGSLAPGAPTIPTSHCSSVLSPRAPARRAESGVADTQVPVIASSLHDEVRLPSRASAPEDVFALARMNVFCNINCCPYDGKCGNGLAESDKVRLMRNTRTSSLGLVAAEDIGAGQVLDQYLGEMERVRISSRDRPRNRGYWLIMKTRPELPASPVRMAIYAEGMGGMMRFVNHSCEPVVDFREVANGRRTTVDVTSSAQVRR
uniref:SET domain-containing protein n=1 Tax=Phytophthora ramorum TaxID=164328 RepID=H3GUB8_PHYRM